MHEQSLVAALLKQVTGIAADHGGADVTEIEVEIGPLSGVEPLLVESAFERLVPQTAFSETRLVVRCIPLQGVCRTCDRDFAAPELRFDCPLCGARHIRIVRGEEFRLMSVTLEDGESPAEWSRRAAAPHPRTADSGLSPQQEGPRSRLRLPPSSPLFCRRKFRHDHDKSPCGSGRSG